MSYEAYNLIFNIFSTTRQDTKITKSWILQIDIFPKNTRIWTSEYTLIIQMIQILNNFESKL